MEAIQHIDPVVRWQVGHHVFFVLVQGIDLVLHRFEQAIKIGNLDEADDALETASMLFWGSAASLHFTGAFSEDDYTENVRPSMEPPRVREGFSGLMSADHDHMVRTLIRLKPIFEELPTTLRRKHGRFIAAMDASMKSHKFVCGYFGGNEEASLRMSKKSKKSAVQVIDGLGESRLQLVDPHNVRRRNVHDLQK